MPLTIYICIYTGVLVRVGRQLSVGFAWLGLEFRATWIWSVACYNVPGVGYLVVFGKVVAVGLQLPSTSRYPSD